MQLAVTRLDAKGRISIPTHFRDSIGIKGEGVVALVTNGKRELAVVPSESGGVITVTTTMKDLQSGMRKILDVFNSHKISLLSLESFTVERDERFECVATFEPNGFSLEQLRKEIKDDNIDEIETYSLLS